MARLPAVLLLLAAAACGGPEGTATVTGHLSITDCRASMPNVLSDIEFEAGYLATERYSGILLISIQKHAVEVEESDGLVIRFHLDTLLARGALIVDAQREQIDRADPAQPVLIRTSTRPEDANASLSLFQTCPEFPTSYATGGVLSLSKVTLAALPQHTGEGERLAGTLTATMARASSRSPIGTIEASFDFAPPRRPLTDFK